VLAPLALRSVTTLRLRAYGQAVLADGQVDLVAPDGAELGVLVLHPHPDFGGDRFNPVVDAIFRAAVAEGWAAVRFDFSSSELSQAVAEATDALGRLPKALPLAVAGYSFGGGIATQVLDARIVQWVLVAPPLTMVDFPTDAIASDPRPKLVLSPTRDQYCPPAEAADATATWAATTVEPIDGADHFLAGATRGDAQRAVDVIRSSCRR
jgi:alpha/beta superfamily hydrolase